MSDPLSISAGAVTVYQRVLSTVSQNIANVGNADYVKQQSLIGQSPPTFDGRTYLGSGALFEGVQRQYNAFIESSLRRSTSDLAAQEKLVSYASRIIDVLGSGDIGLSPALDAFFASARTLATDPASTVSRLDLLRQSAGVASRFNDLSEQLSQLDLETQQGIDSNVGQINVLSAQLAKVNQELAKHDTLAKQPAAMLDQRDALLRGLSDLIDVQVSELDNGSVTVTVGGAGSSGALVAGATFKPLQARFDASAPERIDLLLDPYGASTQPISGATGGAYGGLSSFRAQLLAPAQAQLDTLAKILMTEVNAAHRQGVDGRGQAGGALFALQPQFSIDRQGGTSSLTLQANLADPAAFDGRDIEVSFDAQAGQVNQVSLLGPFQAGDRIAVTLNGASQSFALLADATPAEVTAQLAQFIDGTFGVQLRPSVDANGQLVVSSSVLRNFNFGVDVSSAEARAQVDRSQGLWTAMDTATGERVTGATSLQIRGVRLDIQGTPADGERFRVSADQRPAACLRSLLDDPMLVAAAGGFRAVRDTANLSGGQADLVEVPAAAARAPAPALGSPGGLASNPVASAALSWDATRQSPVAIITAGQKDVTVYLDPGSSEAELQVLTRDGRHVLGRAISDGASFVANNTQAFAPGSSYDTQYLNVSGAAGYRGLSVFYGAQAGARTVPVLGLDHVAASLRTIDARLAADQPPASGSLSIAAGALTLNGQALPAFSGAGAAALADWINDNAGASGVVASVNSDGALEMTVAATQGDGTICLGLGSSGDPGTLAKLGFRTAAYIHGQVPEDLLVFATGSGPVRVGAEFSGRAWSAAERREQVRQNPFDITFTSATTYTITDRNTGTALASRAYAEGDIIDYNGLALSLSAAPSAGDVYHVDGNQDGLGDNQTALALANLQTKAVAGSGNALTLSEAYLDAVNGLANLTQQSQTSAKALEIVKQQAVDARGSVSGVNLEEEAADLIRFQQAYQAAAKSMQIATQMFDTLVRI